MTSLGKNEVMPLDLRALDAWPPAQFITFGKISAKNQSFAAYGTLNRLSNMVVSK